jgi:hypothetical protein
MTSPAPDLIASEFRRLAHEAIDIREIATTPMAR